MTWHCASCGTTLTWAAPITVNPGDEVRVIEGRRRYGRSNIWTGRITSVARKYATAEYEVDTTYLNGKPKREKRTIEFDMATGYERYTYGTYGSRVRTPAQLDRAERHAAAVALLKAHHLEFAPGHANSFTLEQVEALAEVVKTWDQEADR